MKELVILFRADYKIDRKKNTVTWALYNSRLVIGEFGIVLVKIVKQKYKTKKQKILLFIDSTYTCKHDNTTFNRFAKTVFV